MADGVVQTARKLRCIACNNCVLACPFGVPKMQTEMRLMMVGLGAWVITFIGLLNELRRFGRTRERSRHSLE